MLVAMCNQIHGQLFQKKNMHDYGKGNKNLD